MKESKHPETVWYSVPPERVVRGLGRAADRTPHQSSETVTVPVKDIDTVEDPALRDALHRQDLSNKSPKGSFVVPIADENHRLVRVVTVPKQPLSLRDPGI